jgi:hypothetical protein
MFIDIKIIFHRLKLLSSTGDVRNEGQCRLWQSNIISESILQNANNFSPYTPTKTNLHNTECYTCQKNFVSIIPNIKQFSKN